MSYKVVFYKTNRGDLPVLEFIKKFDSKVSSKFYCYTQMLSELGPDLSTPYSKKINHELSELRIRGKCEIRILYSRVSDKYILLHAFQKKTRKTPSREIDTAKSRLLTCS